MEARRSAHVEAITHLTKGLELLLRLPEALARAQDEHILQIALGASLVITQGYTDPTAEHAYARARALCQQVGDTGPAIPGRICPVGDLCESRRAQNRAGSRGRTPDPRPASRQPNHPGGRASYVGSTWYWLGELAQARHSLEHALALEAHQPQVRDAAATARVARVADFGYDAWTLWVLGYPEQAQQRNHQALALANPWPTPSVRWWPCSMRPCSNYSAVKGLPPKSVLRRS